MESKKLFFGSSVVWKEKTIGELSAPGVHETVEVATPIEFPDGIKGKWSPESLFLSAITSCLLATFLSIAKRKNLAFIKFQCDAEGVVEPVNGKLEFTEVNLYPELHLMDESQKLLAEEILERAEHYCLISNSLKSKVIMHATITAEAELVLS